MRLGIGFKSSRRLETLVHNFVAVQERMLLSCPFIFPMNGRNFCSLPVTVCDVITTRCSDDGIVDTLSNSGDIHSVRLISRDEVGFASFYLARKRKRTFHHLMLIPATLSVTSCVSDRPFPFSLLGLLKVLTRKLKALRNCSLLFYTAYHHCSLRLSLWYSYMIAFQVRNHFSFIPFWTCSQLIYRYEDVSASS